MPVWIGSQVQALSRPERLVMPRARSAAAQPEPAKGTPVRPVRASRAKKAATAEVPPAEIGGALDAAGPLDPEAAVAIFLETLDAGMTWYPALLSVVARWTAASEEIDGITRQYLIGGEAFDWLRLAERLVEAAGERIPAAEAERLIFQNEPPDGADEEAFARAIGPQKHRAHLNFQYGVVIEETLLLDAELDLHKARAIDGIRGEPPDVVAYERVYGKTLQELMALYRSETGAPLGDRVRQPDWQAFTYWCSKYRFRFGEPARVASDTRKALALLSRLHAERVRLVVVPEETRYVESGFVYGDEDGDEDGE